MCTCTSIWVHARVDREVVWLVREELGDREVVRLVSQEFGDREVVRLVWEGYVIGK